jgi:hypothetical protein
MPTMPLQLPGSHHSLYGCILAIYQINVLQTLPPQRSELGLTVLSQLSIVVQISAFAFSLAHSGILLKISSWLRSVLGRRASTAGV